MFIRLIFISICLFVFSNEPKNEHEFSFVSSDTPEAVLYKAEKNSWIYSTTSSMSLREKIGQFFMAAVYSRENESHKQEIETLISDYHIGGLIFFQGHPTKQALWTTSFQEQSKIPLLISIDGEWGISMRLDSSLVYPRQLTLGAIQNNDLMYDLGRRIAQECRAIGININLAPVVDVNNNPLNPVINDRSFGEDKYNVSLKGLAYMQGMQDERVLAVAKHFPGHGNTDKDSHKTLPVILQSKADLEKTELFPFKTLFNNGVGGVMAAHLNIPALDSTENLAVSLSPKVTTSLLREELKFDGLVFSDALNMKGVSNFFEPGEVDLKAFLAGNDILLFSVDIPKGIALIEQAVQDSVITESYIDERLRRVLSAKYDLGLAQDTTFHVHKDSIVSFLNNSSGKNLQARLYQEAITVAANDSGLLPLSFNPNTTVASLAIGKPKKTSWQDQIESYRTIDSYVVSKKNFPNANMLDTLSAYDEVIVGVHQMSRWASKNHGFSNEELSFLKQLNKATSVTLILFGSPYSLSYFDEFNTIVVAYEDNSLTETAAANVLTGAVSSSGKLPVSSGRYNAGTGVSLDEKSILQYGIPESVGLDADRLDSIDIIAQHAIKTEATPGCQILVARHGTIIYHKTFGHHTYEKKQPVRFSDVYDLASITKIAATTLSVMKLYDEELIELNKSVQDYLPDFKTTDVGAVQLSDLLVHQAGLPSWIPFYKSTINDTIYDVWYCNDTTDGYCINVAEGLYLHKDYSSLMMDVIKNIEINHSPDYLYSDLGLYLLKEIVEKLTGQSLDEYVEKTFYAPMKLQRIGYLPAEKWSLNEIVPTEYDSIFRRQLINGHVHDPGAAMLGGVGGHAGLFSNAFNLASIMQMLLNDGKYHKTRFLNPETISFFTSTHYENNRRGLGFDKPMLDPTESGPTSSYVSPATYGHTGFTGTAAWVDPENGLVYVFLSNRVYPDAKNKLLITESIRTNIQDVIYRSMLDENVLQ